MEAATFSLDDVRALARGDDAAWTQAGPRLTGYLRHAALDAMRAARAPARIIDDLADDAVAAALARVWRSIDRYDPAQASFRAWCWMVARRTAVSALRRRGALRTRIVSDAVDVATAQPPADDVGGAGDALDAAALREAVEAAMQAAAAERPEAVAAYRRHLAGEQQCAIADDLATSRATVCRMVARARGVCRDALAATCAEWADGMATGSDAATPSYEFDRALAAVLQV